MIALSQNHDLQNRMIEQFHILAVVQPAMAGLAETDSILEIVITGLLWLIKQAPETVIYSD